MAHRINMLGSLSLPDSTAGDSFFEPFSIKAVNDQWNHLVPIFNDTASRDGIMGVFDVPQNYTDTANAIIVWTTSSTAGNVVWDFDYRAVGGNDTESLDQAGTQESVGSTDEAPTSPFERMELSIALTDANFAAGDTVQFEINRDGTDSGDTMSAAAMLVGLQFEYST